MNKLIILAIGLIIGTLIGEHKSCVQLNGSYDWEYGTCDTGVKR